MVIGIDASRANRKHRTGTEWYAYYLIRSFAHIDSENEYVLYTDSPLKEGLLNLHEHYEKEEDKIDDKPAYDKDGYQILNSPHKNFKAKILPWPFKFFWTLGGLSLEMLLRKPDVLFVPSHVLPFIRPKKSVVTIHDIGFLKDGSLFAKDDIGPERFNFRSIINIFVKIFTFGRYGANSYDYLKWSTKFALKKATKLIAISHFTKTELMDYYNIGDEKITVVYNGYNKNLYRRIEDKKNLDNILENYGIEQPYFFYIGRLEKKKNIATLVEAFAILRDKYKDLKHKLVLVGNASYGYDEIKYLTREFDIVNEVIMPGWLDEDLIPFIYTGASAFVFPSKYEGFGIPLLQAMACGTPIAASRVSSIPEIAGDAAIYFHPEYSLSIAEAMYATISDEKKVKEIVDKGYKRVEGFSWKNCAKETLEVITK